MNNNTRNSYKYLSTQALSQRAGLKAEAFKSRKHLMAFVAYLEGNLSGTEMRAYCKLVEAGGYYTADLLFTSHAILRTLINKGWVISDAEMVNGEKAYKAL